MGRLVTPNMKDEVLKFIGNQPHGVAVSIGMNEIVKTTGITSKYIRVILEQFELAGIISDYIPATNKVTFVVKNDVHALLSNGGFRADEEQAETKPKNLQ